jgi:formylglycine-generating enzyme required for sulfatase activity
MKTFYRRLRVACLFISTFVFFCGFDVLEKTNDPGDLNTIESISGNMVTISGGTFLMGCTDEDTTCDPDESPQHEVTISPFEISRYEVTQGQWEAVMGSLPSNIESHSLGQGDNYPVYYVSWNDVQGFIDELNFQTDINYRLPTEAEWEYAARAGTETKWYCGDDENCVDDIAWYDEEFGTDKTHPVGQKDSNGWGLYDMSGNVWEWVQDWYSDSYYSVSYSDDPTGPASGSHRVIRGGGWTCNAMISRSSRRISSPPSSRGYGTGFRLVLSP